MDIENMDIMGAYKHFVDVASNRELGDDAQLTEAVFVNGPNANPHTVQNHANPHFEVDSRNKLADVINAKYYLGVGESDEGFRNIRRSLGVPDMETRSLVNTTPLTKREIRTALQTARKWAANIHPSLHSDLLRMAANAYGNGFNEGFDGGVGYMGLVGDEVVKFATHGSEKLPEYIASDHPIMKSSDLLRDKLVRMIDMLRVYVDIRAAGNEDLKAELESVAKLARDLERNRGMEVLSRCTVAQVTMRLARLLSRVDGNQTFADEFKRDVKDLAPRLSTDKIKDTVALFYAKAEANAKGVTVLNKEINLQALGEEFAGLADRSKFIDAIGMIGGNRSVSTFKEELLPKPCNRGGEGFVKGQDALTAKQYRDNVLHARFCGIVKSVDWMVAAFAKNINNERVRKYVVSMFGTFSGSEHGLAKIFRLACWDRSDIKLDGKTYHGMSPAAYRENMMRLSQFLTAIASSALENGSVKAEWYAAARCLSAKISDFVMREYYRTGSADDMEAGLTMSKDAWVDRQSPFNSLAEIVNSGNLAKVDAEADQVAAGAGGDPDDSNSISIEDLELLDNANVNRNQEVNQNQEVGQNQEGDRNQEVGQNQEGDRNQDVNRNQEGNQNRGDVPGVDVAFDEYDEEIPRHPVDQTQNVPQTQDVPQTQNVQQRQDVQQRQGVPQTQNVQQPQNVQPPQQVGGNAPVAGTAPVEGAQRVEAVAPAPKLAPQVAAAKATLEKIFSYVKADGNAQPAGYLGMLENGLPVEFLSQAAERSHIEGGANASKEEKKIADSATKKLREAILGLAKDLKLDKSVVKQLKTLLSGEKKGGVTLVQRNNVADAIRLIAGNAAALKDINFLDSVNSIAAFTDTSFAKACEMARVFKNDGFDAVIAAAENKNPESKEYMSTLPRFINRISSDPDLKIQLRKLAEEMITPSAGEITDPYNLANVGDQNPFSSKIGGTVDLSAQRSDAAKGDEVVVFINFADASKTGGYFHSATTQEEMTIRGFSPITIAMLIAMDQAVWNNFEKDEKGSPYAVGYKRDYGAISPVNGFCVKGFIRDAKTGKLRPAVMLFGASLSLTARNESVDFIGNSRFAIMSRLEVTKDGALRDVFASGTQPEAASKMQENSRMFFSKLHSRIARLPLTKDQFRKYMMLAIFPRRNASFDIFADNVEDQVNLFLNSYPELPYLIAKRDADVLQEIREDGDYDRDRIDKYLASRRELKEMDRKNPRYADLKDEVIVDANYFQNKGLVSKADFDARLAEIDRVLSLNDEQYENELNEKNQKAVALESAFNQEDKDARIRQEQEVGNIYRETLKHSYLKWMAEAAQVGAGRAVKMTSGAMGCGAFDNSPYDVAEAFAEAVMLSGKTCDGQAKARFELLFAAWVGSNANNKTKEDSDFELVFRAAFVKMAAVYGVPWWTKDDNNSMTLEEAEAILAHKQLNPETDTREWKAIHKEFSKVKPRRYNEKDREVLQRWRAESETRYSEFAPQHLKELRDRFAAFDGMLAREFR